jgi:serine/threonine protein kinase, bacterial
VTTEAPSAGWYPDPNGIPGLQYWDGERWHPEIPAPPTASAPATQGRSRRTTIALLVGAVVVIAAAAVGITVYAQHRPSGSSAKPPKPSYGAQSVLPFTGIKDLEGIAVDNTGAVYVTDLPNRRVLKLAAGSSAQTDLYIDKIVNPGFVAVDSGGNVYVTDEGHDRLFWIMAGTPPGYVEMPLPGFAPEGVAVDSASNLYLADGDSQNSRVAKMARDQSTPTALPFTGLKEPFGVAVDSGGNVYVADRDNNRVVKLAAGASTQSELPFTGLNWPIGVAVDGTGNVYVADGNRVVKLAAGP